MRAPPPGLKGAAKRNEGTIFFNPRLPPPAPQLRNIALLLLIAGALLLSPLFLASFDPFTNIYYAGALSSLPSFQLHDQLHTGFFTLTGRSGDTTPSLNATVAAVSALTMAQASIEHAQVLRATAAELAAKPNASVVELRAAAVLGSVGGPADNTLRSRVQAALQALQQPGGGFAAQPGAAASLEATSLALQALQALKAPGLQDTARATASFVRASLGSQLDALTAIWVTQALQVAAAFDTNTSVSLAAALVATQAADGGFHLQPLARNTSALLELELGRGRLLRSNASLSIQALHALHSLRAAGAPVPAPVLTAATDYVRACASSQGVAATFGASGRSLEATAALVELLIAHPLARLGLPASLLLVLQALGCIALLLLMPAYFYAQLASPLTRQVISAGVFAALFLTVGAVGLLYEARGTVLVYVLFAVYVAARVVELGFEHETPDGLASLIGTLMALAQTAVLWLVLRSFPRLLLELRIHVLLTGLPALVAFLAAALSAWSTGVRRVGVYLTGALGGWAAALLAHAVLAFARGDLGAPAAWRLAQVRGHSALLLLPLPLAALVLVLIAVPAGVYVAALETGHVKKSA